MANHRQAAKRNRQRIRRQSRNRHFKSTMRTQIKRVRAALDEGDTAAAKAALEQAVPLIDKLAGKGIIPQRRASRFVSRLTKACSDQPVDKA
ncbi:MAG: 30S ribosomal protein S20 [Myxococcales bacterium]|nr:30S ribosomal protein S20 [Myxococcales bacterium]